MSSKQQDTNEGMNGTNPSPSNPQPFATVGGCGSRTMYDALTNSSDDTFAVQPLTDEETITLVAKAIYAAGIDASNIEQIVHGANDSSPDAFFDTFATHDGHEHIDNNRYEAWWDYIPETVAADVVPVDIDGVVNQRMRNETRYFEIDALIDHVEGVSKDTVISHSKIGDGQYGLYYKLAGLDRNSTMGDVADAFIAFWDGKSSGTKDMIETAKENGVYVQVFQFDHQRNAPEDEIKRVKRDIEFLLPDRFKY